MGGGEGTGSLAADLSGEVQPEKGEDSQGGGHKGSRPVREDVGEFEGLIRVWHVLWQRGGTQ